MKLGSPYLGTTMVQLHVTGIFNARTDVDACDCTRGLSEKSLAAPGTRTRVSIAPDYPVGRSIHFFPLSQPLLLSGVLFASPSLVKKHWFMDTVLSYPLVLDEKLKGLTSLAVLAPNRSFWWWQWSVGYIPTPPPASLSAPVPLW